MFLVIEGQDSECPRLNTRLVFISKAHCTQYFAGVSNEGLSIVLQDCSPRNSEIA